MFYPLGLESFGLNRKLEAQGLGVPIDWHVDYTHSLIGTLAMMVGFSFLMANRNKSAYQQSRMGMALLLSLLLLLFYSLVVV